MVTVRPAEAADLPALAAIEDAGDTRFAELFGSPDWPAATSGEERAAVPGILLVAVDDDGTLVGFAHALDLDGHWHLEQITVHPAHGRRGTGTRLLEATHAEVARRGVTEVTLTTYADVPLNGPWYSRHGYAVLEPLPDHLRPLEVSDEPFDLARHARRVTMVRDLRDRRYPVGGLPFEPGG